LADHDAGTGRAMVSGAPPLLYSFTFHPGIRKSSQVQLLEILDIGRSSEEPAQLLQNTIALNEIQIGFVVLFAQPLFIQQHFMMAIIIKHANPPIAFESSDVREVCFQEKKQGIKLLWLYLAVKSHSDAHIGSLENV
jgi:hypothetical protein